MSYKVVCNDCYGGFGLSPEGEQMLRRLGYYGDPDRIARHDPRLVRVVECLGAAANGEHADLRVVRLRGPLYIISEYDGREHVREPDDIRWIRIR